MSLKPLQSFLTRKTYICIYLNREDWEGSAYLIYSLEELKGSWEKRGLISLIEVEGVIGFLPLLDKLLFFLTVSAKEGLEKWGDRGGYFLVASEREGWSETLAKSLVKALYMLITWEDKVLILWLISALRFRKEVLKEKEKNLWLRKEMALLFCI